MHEEHLMPALILDCPLSPLPLALSRPLIDAFQHQHMVTYVRQSASSSQPLHPPFHA